MITRLAVSPEHGSHSRVVEENRRGTGIQQRYLHPLATLTDLETSFYTPPAVGTRRGARESEPDLYARGVGKHQRIGRTDIGDSIGGHRLPASRSAAGENDGESDAPGLTVRQVRPAGSGCDVSGGASSSVVASSIAAAMSIVSGVPSSVTASTSRISGDRRR